MKGMKLEEGQGAATKEKYDVGRGWILVPGYGRVPRSAEPDCHCEHCGRVCSKKQTLEMHI